VTKIKICGIKTIEDAKIAVSLGVDFLGFNFYPPSKRYIEPEKARDIIDDLDDKVINIGVFVNEPLEKVRRVIEVSGIDIVQLHGDEDTDYISQLDLKVIKALRVGGPADISGLENYGAYALLVDSRTKEYGGSGKKADWDLAKKVGDYTDRLMLAGGLVPENVAEAIKKVRPWAVDTASGVESGPGKKDPEKIKRFIEEVKNGP
jgi:phosphoribosylanthranilate isomerase